MSNQDKETTPYLSVNKAKLLTQYEYNEDDDTVITSESRANLRITQLKSELAEIDAKLLQLKSKDRYTILAEKMRVLEDMQIKIQLSKQSYINEGKQAIANSIDAVTEYINSTAQVIVDNSKLDENIKALEERIALLNKAQADNNYSMVAEMMGDDFIAAEKLRVDELVKEKSVSELPKPDTDKVFKEFKAKAKMALGEENMKE
jgi:hypothetical protein